MSAITQIKSGMEDVLMKAVTLHGRCYIADGFGRQQTWDGWAAATQNHGIEKPPSAPTDEGTNISGSLTVGGKYKARVEYYNNDKDQPSAYSPASAVITCQSNGGIRITVPADSAVDSQVTHIRCGLTADGQNVFRRDGGTTEVMKAYTGSAITFDFTVAENARKIVMGRLNTAGTANLNIHGVPPTCPFMVVYQDKIFMFGTRVFSGGTATMTADPTVTIAGDVLPTGIKNMYFQVDGDSRRYNIDSRTDDTNFELKESYAGSTGALKTYYIYGDSAVLFWTYIDENLVSYPGSWRASDFLPINADDNWKGTGLGIAHNQIIILKERSVGRLSGSSSLDYFYSPISDEIGCVAPYTIHTNKNGDCVFLSDRGLYLTDGVNLVNLAEGSIDNMFTGEGDPPWKVEKSRLAHAVAEYDEENNRSHLKISSTGETTNNKYLEFDYNKLDDVMAGWNDGDGIVGHAIGVIEDSDGRQRLAFGCNGGVDADKGFVYYYDKDATNDGAGDGTTVRGTATAVSSTEITDDDANFTDDIIGCTCFMIAGTSIGSSSRIKTRDSTTKFTVETAFDTTPVIGDTYSIGALDSYRVTKWYDWGTLGDKVLEWIKIAFKQVSYSLNFYMYRNKSSTASITKTLDMDTADRYRRFKAGLNRGNLHQFKVGIKDVGKPFEITEMEFTSKLQGKPSDHQETT